MSKYIKLKLFYVQYDDGYDVYIELNLDAFLFEQRVSITREIVCGPYSINKSSGLMCMSSVSWIQLKYPGF